MKLKVSTKKSGGHNFSLHIREIPQQCNILHLEKAILKLRRKRLYLKHTDTQLQHLGFHKTFSK